MSRWPGSAAPVGLMRERGEMREVFAASVKS
jgi:hypothetical protein